MTEYLLTWNELADIARLGLGIEHGFMLQDAGTEFHGNPSTEALAEMEKLDWAKRKPAGGMTVRLNELFIKATREQGTAQRIPDLGSGLGVDLMVGIDGAIRLQISRSGKTPHKNEWETVLKYFPFAVVTENERRFISRGRHFIQAELLLSHQERTNEQAKTLPLFGNQPAAVDSLPIDRS